MYDLLTTGVLAAETISETTLWSSSAGVVVRALLGTAGAVIAVMGVFRAASAFMAAKAPEGLRVLAGTIVLCAFLFQPMLLNELLGVLGKIVETFLRGGAEVVTDAKRNAPPP